ncbi:MAG: extracellular solute-binding protein [Armatimonadetes bacterium]|nr:extracellular solute-binding protein [Armatimonadota bacterium]
MGVPPRRRRLGSGTAVIRLAVPVLLCGSWAAADAESKSPVSIQLWREHFAGEGAYLADLQGSYLRASGRKVELYEGEWRESERKIEDWTQRLERYAPDLMVVQDAQLPLVLGSAASLEGRFPPSFLQALWPGALAQGRVQGVQVALPWRAHPLALYYNTDLFMAAGASPPATPEDLLTVAGKLSDPPNVYGLGLPGGTGGGAADCFMALFRGQGGLLFDDRGRLSLNSDAGLGALQLFSELTRSRSTQPEVLTWTSPELARLFLQGRLAMLIEGPWLLREASLTPPPFKPGVAPVPRAKGGAEHLTADCVFIFDAARDIDGCVDFLQYALGQERQRALSALGVPSVRRDVGAALPAGEGWEVFTRALREGRGPSASSWDEIASLLERLIFLTVSGRATPEAAIDAIDIDLLDEPEHPGPDRP